VSALAGGLAGALAAMVARLTLKKEKFAEVHPLMEELGQEAEALHGKLMAAVDEDADSYRQVLAAFRLPKSDEAAKKARRDAIQAAFLHAAQVPLKVAEWSAQVMELAGKAASRGNPDMVTDAAVGLFMARSAVLGALMNVRINLDSIEETEAVAAMRKRARDMEKAVTEREKKLSALLSAGRG
jgi:formiminotetrahydrofolate cyclodeaminase